MIKVNASQIPLEGLLLEEKISSGEFDLETDVINFREPINLSARITRITNVITVNLSLSGKMYSYCSRCLEEFEIALKKDWQLNYPLEKNQIEIDLGPDIRQEIILEYPMKPLCRKDCKGLCPKCGKNLNEGGCNCAVT